MKISTKYVKVILLRNNNLVFSEHKATPFRAKLIGWIWKYIPDLTYKNRDFLIVDWWERNDNNIHQICLN